LKRYVTTRGVTASAATIRELSGVVTVSDDGGSSGRLRKEFTASAGRCAELHRALSEDEALLSRLFQHALTRIGTGRAQLRNLFSRLTSIPETLRKRSVVVGDL